jgi:hypothetical protein
MSQIWKIKDLDDVGVGLQRVNRKNLWEIGCYLFLLDPPRH